MNEIEEFFIAWNGVLETDRSRVLDGFVSWTYDYLDETREALEAQDYDSIALDLMQTMEDGADEPPNSTLGEIREWLSENRDDLVARIREDDLYAAEDDDQ